MRFRIHILGRLEALDGTRQVELGSFKQRAALGLLLCRANQLVSVSALSDALWNDAPPLSAHKNIQGYISGLRRVLAPDAGIRILHSPPGYLIRLPPDRLDALQFREFVRAGRRALRADDTESATDILGQAVRMWHAPVLPDLVAVPAVAAEVRRLRELHLVAYEDWAELKIGLGEHGELIERVDELVVEHPFRERLQHVLMLALYRSGRQSEALARFDAMRIRLAQELGLEPSAQLMQLRDAMLSADPSLDWANRARPATHVAEHTSLPRDVAHFVGRDKVMASMEEVLRGPGSGVVVAINGGAGAGKTALAIHCARRLAEHFADGRILVCLRTAGGLRRPVADVLGDLLRKLGCAGALPSGQEERAALVREAVAGRRMLLILDDAVDESQVGPILAATGDASAVVTCRRHLAALDSVLDLALPALAGSEALELLSRLVGRERVAAEPAEAVQLVEACGGLPLAVRIVGSRLAGLGHLSLARFGGRLADEDRLLDELVAGDMQVRSRLEAAYQDLTPAGRATLCRLAALPIGTFTAAAVADTLGMTSARAEAAIEQLIEAHVVDAHVADVTAHVADVGRYSVAALMRIFVRERDALQRS
jgi:DNA-binding SARP family transcriptional activator